VNERTVLCRGYLRISYKPGSGDPVAGKPYRPEEVPHIDVEITRVSGSAGSNNWEYGELVLVVSGVPAEEERR
jgi:hypothetical protein